MRSNHDSTRSWRLGRSMSLILSAAVFTLTFSPAYAGDKGGGKDKGGKPPKAAKQSGNSDKPQKFSGPSNFRDDRKDSNNKRDKNNDWNKKSDWNKKDDRRDWNNKRNDNDRRDQRPDWNNKKDWDDKKDKNDWNKDNRRSWNDNRNDNRRDWSRDRRDWNKRYDDRINWNASNVHWNPYTNWNDNRDRYKNWKKYHKTWKEQRKYLQSNMKNFNRLARLNNIQQQQLDNQMRSAYMAYRGNNWNGPYGWNYYDEPGFLDYLHTNNSGLLNNILSYIGIAPNSGYLYSPVWNDERSQLSREMARIRQLRVEGRISSSEERTLMNQLQAEYMSYRNNNWNGTLGWSQYSDPSFLDYLNNRRPSVLMTIRDFLTR